MIQIFRNLVKGNLLSKTFNVTYDLFEGTTLD